MPEVPERLQESASVAEPVSEAGPQTPVGLGPGPLTPARIMAMQRSAGNAAVSAMLNGGAGRTGVQRMTATDLPALGDGELAQRLQPRPVRRGAGGGLGAAAQGGGAAGAAPAGAAGAASAAGAAPTGATWAAGAAAAGPAGAPGAAGAA